MLFNMCCGPVSLCPSPPRSYRIYKNVTYNPATDGISNGTITVQVIPILTAIISVKSGVYVTQRSAGLRVCVALRVTLLSLFVFRHRVTGITWDDGCFFCTTADPTCIAYALNSSYFVSPASSDYHSCAQANYTSTCVQQTTTPYTNVCDLKVYVVWTGTDSAGDSFSSAGVCPSCSPC